LVVYVGVAGADGGALGGGVVFYGASEFFFWSAAMLAEFGRLRPSNALNFALMRAAADRGMSWYNLGSSEGLPGVARFKSDLGAQGVEYRDVALARARFKLYRTVRRAIATRAAV
jgi:lipid II:glycine glycyltransferase (peptidoglycan interpeptide bridge formation enzyme)